MIETDNIRACSDHRVVQPDEFPCPCCETGVEARPEAVENIEFTDVDLRWQIEPETLQELLPLLEENAAQVNEGPVYVSVAEVDAGETAGSFIESAAGYTTNERWFNVAVVEYGNQQRDIIKHESTARDVIDAIKDGGQWVESPTHDESHLDPEEWKGVLAPYIQGEDDFEFERDGSTLRVTVDVPGSDVHTELRREMGMVAESLDLQIQTKNAGGRFEESVIEIST